jgi:hypothetical protein
MIIDVMPPAFIGPIACPDVQVPLLACSRASASANDLALQA